MAKINCENRNPRKKIEIARFKKVASYVLGRLNRRDAEIDLVFLADRAIRALNRKYFKKDRATDVISFPDNEGAFMGCVAVSTDTAARNALYYGTSFREEAALYVIHGILHLAGYKDAKPRDRARMKKKEEGLLGEARRFL